MVGEPINRESYGIAFRPDDALLKGAVDAALDQLDRDGTTAGLRARWNLEAP
jgi:ABC-type amino acid transport substrate-binding protein